MYLHHNFALPRNKFLLRWFVSLLAEPHLQLAAVLDLALQDEQRVEQGLRRGGAARHIDVHRDDPVAAPNHGVAVVVVAPAIGAGTHGEHPLGLRHLVVGDPEGVRHLVGDSPCHDEDIRLAGSLSEHHAKPVHVVPRGGAVHHLHGAAGQAEGQGPHLAFQSPVDQIVETSNAPLCLAVSLLEGAVGLVLLRLSRRGLLCGDRGQGLGLAGGDGPALLQEGRALARRSGTNSSNHDASCYEVLNNPKG